jgi:hypothetical protein
MSKLWLRNLGYIINPLLKVFKEPLRNWALKCVLWGIQVGCMSVTIRSRIVRTGYTHTIKPTNPMGWSSHRKLTVEQLPKKFVSINGKWMFLYIFTKTPILGTILSQMNPLIFIPSYPHRRMICRNVICLLYVPQGLWIEPETSRCE